MICSLALARLRIAKDKDSSAFIMAQKLLLFWRKPAVAPSPPPSFLFFPSL